jgi:Zn-finger nucleic acid-binding protein
MICPGCGAPMRLDSDTFRCEYCRSTYRPEKNEEGIRELGEKSPLSCPVCALPLEEATLADRRVLYCEQCRGTLIAMKEFVILVEELRGRRDGGGSIQSPPDRSGLERRLACPKCRRPMDTHFYEGPGNIIIDDCSHCFLNWLDQGELMRIVRAPERSYGDSYGIPITSN